MEPRDPRGHQIIERPSVQVFACRERAMESKGGFCMRIKKGDAGEYMIAGCRPVSLLRCAKLHRTADGALRDPLISVCTRNIYIIRHNRPPVK